MRGLPYLARSEETGRQGGWVRRAAGGGLGSRLVSSPKEKLAPGSAQIAGGTDNAEMCSGGDRSSPPNSHTSSDHPPIQFNAVGQCITIPVHCLVTHDGMRQGFRPTWQQPDTDSRQKIVLSRYRVSLRLSGIRGALCAYSWWPSIHRRDLFFTESCGTELKNAVFSDGAVRKASLVSSLTAERIGPVR